MKTLLSLAFLASALAADVYVPFYDTSANGYAAPARGWNSFGIQANQPLQGSVGWDFNDWQCVFDQHCSLLPPDYYCSLDSGWSNDGGDAHGRIVANDAGVFNTYGSLKNFTAHMKEKGIKVGVYLLPGALSGDANMTIEGKEDLTLGDIFDTNVNETNLRLPFLWGQPGVQEWHDSEVRYLVDQGVEFIKLDFVTPGSDQPGLPADTSMSAFHYHTAIQNIAPDGKIRLDLSWHLSRESPYFERWQANADSIRLDDDINNSNSTSLTSWKTVQRAIEAYRVFINQQTLNATRHGVGIRVRPDMDNLYVGNAQQMSGVSDVERYSMAIHWIGAGANLITGSDMTHLDDLGKELLFNDEAMDVANFTSQWPMQPLLNGGAPSQLQAWIAGPNEKGTAVVVLANYGPDLGDGGFGTNSSDVQLVSAPLDVLGIAGSSWAVRRVWGGGGSGGGDHEDIGVTSDKLESNLGPGESVLYKIQRQ
ncbi:glycoside hydrolase family 27 protein [Exidia glandulosa HHB12029]|uniref:alpha-galactosidase n=1 Tax=Exidia glandulosa HHB12029 TaxID=1314781 RepID=A0A165NWU4_EXIGL|nr:glycoside hydrolase family 27 protein [Exidia glandulosa HHB12029]